MIPAMERQRENGNYRMRSLFETEEAKEYTYIDGEKELSMLVNVNTEEDFQRMKRKSEGRICSQSGRYKKCEAARIMTGAPIPAGAEMRVEKIAVKPGSPSTVSVMKGKLIISLSENPFAAAAQTELLVRCALACLSGCEELFPKEERGVLGTKFEKSAKCDRYIRGKKYNEKIYLTVEKEKSGIFSSLNGCNCLAKIEKGKEKVAETEQVWYIRI